MAERRGILSLEQSLFVILHLHPWDSPPPPSSSVLLLLLRPNFRILFFDSVGTMDGLTVERIRAELSTILGPLTFLFTEGFRPVEDRSGSQKWRVQTRAERLAPKSPDRIIGGVPPSSPRGLFCPVIGPAATTLFGPCIVSVLSVGKSSRRIRPAGQDPCCSSFAYLPSHRSRMFDAFGSLICLQPTRDANPTKFPIPTLTGRTREIGTSFRDPSWPNQAIVVPFGLGLLVVGLPGWVMG